MSFSPVLPATGTLGWSFLQRTSATQQAALAKSPEIQRDADYFRSRIAKVETADQLVADRRLLRISLEAFGLDADLDSRAFIRKVLSEGTLTAGAFAMRLADPRYKALSAAFGFGDFPVPNTRLSDFADKFLAQWQTRRFEAAVGEQNDDYRLALNAKRELAALSASTSSETTKWLRVISNTPLRKVVQKAFNLPDSFVGLDLDRQVSVLKDRATATFGSSGVSQFSDPAKTEELVRRFLVRSELSAVATNSPALGLLLQTRNFARRI